MNKRRTNKPTETKAVTGRINFEKPEGHQIVYSNIIQLMHTPYDFQLTFGLIDSGSIKSTDLTAKVQTVATVMLSPQHAKQLATVLNQNLAKYETNYMVLPTDLTPKADLEDGEIEVDLTEEVH